MTLKRITAGDVMTSPVYIVGPDDPMARIIALLCTRRISGLSVVDSDGHLMGLVSERDILDAMHPGTAGLRGKNPRRRHGHDLRDISGLRIPIVTGRKLVGIVSHGGVYRAIFETHPRPSAQGGWQASGGGGNT